MIDVKFVGSYNGKVDSKKRVTVPLVFRKVLDSNRLILSYEHVLSFPMIAVFNDSNVFYRIMEDYFGKKSSEIDFSRHVSSISRIVDIDSAHRVALGVDSFLEPKDEVTFVGIRDYFEIWKTEDYERYSKREKNLHL